jgi:hypothetical protein
MLPRLNLYFDFYLHVSTLYFKTIALAITRILFPLAAGLRLLHSIQSIIITDYRTIEIVR